MHPTSTRADPATGNPIDAGNYYLNKGNYSNDDNVIAAHEYGHLLGIDDEYSQSNEMLNALLHQAAPENAPSAMAALDKKTVERMVLASLKRPLLDRLAADPAGGHRRVPGQTGRCENEDGGRRPVRSCRRRSAHRAGEASDGSLRTGLDPQRAPGCGLPDRRRTSATSPLPAKEWRPASTPRRWRRESCRCTKSRSTPRRLRRSVWPGSGTPGSTCTARSRR